MGKNNPEPKKEVSTRLDRVLGALKKDYFLIGKRNVRSWHAYLAMGVMVGLVIGVGYTINTGQFQNFFAATNTSASVVFPSWYRFEPIAFTLKNNTNQSLPLGTTNPWKIVDSSGNLVYQPPTQGTLSLPKKASMQWTWNQKDSAGFFVSPGDYKVVFDSFGVSASFSVLPDEGSSGFVTYSFASINSSDELKILIVDTKVLRSAIDNYYDKNTKHAPLGVLVDDRPNKSAVDPQWSWHLSKLDIASKCNTTDANNLTPSKIEGNLNYYFSNNRTKNACFGSAQVSSLNSPQLTSMGAPTQQIYTSDTATFISDVYNTVQQMNAAMPYVDQVVQIAQNGGLIVQQNGSLEDGLLITIINPNTNGIVKIIFGIAATLQGNTTGKTADCKIDDTNYTIIVDKNGKTYGTDNHDFSLIFPSGADQAIKDALSPYSNVLGPHQVAQGTSGATVIKILETSDLGTINGNMVAAATYFDPIENKIYILLSQAALAGANEQLIAAFLEHEFGHAIYGLFHTDGGIMNPVTPFGSQPTTVPPDMLKVLNDLASCSSGDTTKCQQLKECTAKCPNAGEDWNSLGGTCEQTATSTATSTYIGGGGDDSPLLFPDSSCASTGYYSGTDNDGHIVYYYTDCYGNYQQCQYMGSDYFACGSVACIPNATGCEIETLSVY